MMTTSANGIRSNRTSLHCEELESRSNPSSVSATFNSAGNLVVTGDSNSNEFIVEENSAGQFLVIGENGTTINGLTSINFGRIHPTDVVIKDGNGNDQISVIGISIADGFTLTTGSGNDVVNLDGVLANYVSVSASGGNNTLVTTDVIARIGANITAGSGTNYWYDNSFVVGDYLTHSGWKIEG